MHVDAQPRYRQDGEAQLREQIFRAETLIVTGSLDSSDKLYDLDVLLIARESYKTAGEVIRKLVKSRESQSSDDGDDRVAKLRATYQG